MPTRTAVVKQIKGIALAAKADSGHWTLMDGHPDHGGSNAGSRPKELLLFALGGCTAMDVLPILKKKRVPLEDFEINIRAEVREEHPQVYTSIHLEYVFYGEGITKEDVERAIDLSLTKYCAVTAMLSAAVPISHSYRIEPPARKEIRQAPETHSSMR
jgi:putative redox protein